MREQPHALRWLEKITVNLLRENLLHGNLSGNLTQSLLSNAAIQSAGHPEKISDISTHSLSPKVLNQLYKAIIDTSKVLKLMPQANESFILEKLYFSFDDIVHPA